jgi:hypothetical protein
MSVLGVVVIIVLLLFVPMSLSGLYATSEVETK